MSAQAAASTDIRVTDAALRRIATILDGDADKNALRISVEGGGCSGFSYRYDLVNNDRQPDDFVVEEHGALVLIDPMSVQYLTGSEVDFVDDLMGQSFQIRNPNAVASCGCGTSFSI